jgi:hypothetical protein
MIEAVGNISVAYTIYLKNRNVTRTETVGSEVQKDNIEYEKLPNHLIKAYQAWLMNLKP